MLIEPPDSRRIARLEETRQAISTEELADESEPLADGSMSFAGVGAWANQACGVGLDGPVSEAELDRLVSYYVERGVEPRIEACAMADDTLHAGLAARGFTVREYENVLVREPGAGAEVEAVEMAASEAEIELRLVDRADPAMVELFVDVSNVGFRPPGEPVPEPLARLTRRMVAHPRATCHLAYIDGLAVGGSGMGVSNPILGSRVACLFGTSVRESYRRRGVQLALIAARLRVAHDAGAEFVCIHSKPGIPTERNAARIGFALVYTKAALAMAGEGLVPSP